VRRPLLDRGDLDPLRLPAVSRNPPAESDQDPRGYPRPLLVPGRALWRVVALPLVRRTFQVAVPLQLSDK
jgi:hypothetical protein